jgi:hypothetical protein
MSCGGKVRIPDAVDSRKKLHCPKCQAEVPVPESHKVVVAEVDQNPDRESEETKSCPFCGGTIRKEAVRCKHCKTDLPSSTLRAGFDQAGPSSGDRECGPGSINDMIPEEYRDKLRPNEKAFEFAYIDTKGGCGTTQKANQWILITDQRILYEATTRDERATSAKYLRTSGSIPTSRVSFVGTTTADDKEGCNQTRVSLLKINSGGGGIEIVIATEKEAKRLQRAIDELISAP